jgi:peroxiredoxin
VAAWKHLTIKRALAAGGILTLAVGLTLLLLRPAGPLPAAPTAGHPAPALSLRTTAGGQQSLAAYRGRVVLVNFFATWCVPCTSEMPAIERLYRARHSVLTVLAVDNREPASDVSRFGRAHRLTFPLLLDSTGRVDDAYSVAVQPESFWVDRQGTIRSVHYGPMTPHFMRQELNRLLSRRA